MSQQPMITDFVRSTPKDKENGDSYRDVDDQSNSDPESPAPRQPYKRQLNDSGSSIHDPSGIPGTSSGEISTLSSTRGPGMANPFTSQVELMKQAMAPLFASQFAQFRDEIKSDLRDYIDITVSKTVSKTFDEKMKKLNESHARDIDLLKSDVETLKHENISLNEKLQRVSIESNHNAQYSRKATIRIMGIPESDAELQDPKNIDHCITQTCDALNKTPLVPKLTPDAIEVGHRLPGMPDKSKKGRWVILKLQSTRLRNDILANRSMLKGSGIRIYEDLSPANRSLLKSLEQHPDISSSWSDHGKIFGKAGNIQHT